MMHILKRPRLAVLAALAAALTALPLVLLAGAASAAPPPPLTNRYIVSDEGAANCLDVFENPHTGNQIGVSGACTNTNGGYWSEWSFQIESGGLYYIHPFFDDSVCLTLSTTQNGVSKTETCVGAANQLFTDASEGNGNYVIYNADLNTYLNDPHIGSGTRHIAGTVKPCAPGANGCTWAQE